MPSKCPMTSCCNNPQSSVFLKEYGKGAWLSASRINSRKKHIFEPYGQAVYLESLESIQTIFHQKRTIVREGSNHGNCSTLLGWAPMILQKFFVKLSNYIQTQITILALRVIIVSLWIYIPPITYLLNSL